jgi:hypothetical protein
MASLLISQNNRVMEVAPHGLDGMQFANSAIEFAALAWEAEKHGIVGSRLHLYALAIELALKSLALRSGATPGECKSVAGHKISAMIRLVEGRGVIVCKDLQLRLNDDKWFQMMLATRYPVFIVNPAFEDTLFFHKRYPETIAEILEIPCDSPLSFEGDSALNEIKTLLARKRSRTARLRT